MRQPSTDAVTDPRARLMIVVVLVAACAFGANEMPEVLQTETNHVIVVKVQCARLLLPHARISLLYPPQFYSLFSRRCIHVPAGLTYCACVSVWSRQRGLKHSCVRPVVRKPFDCAAMPNWCSNCIDVEGSHADVVAILSARKEMHHRNAPQAMPLRNKMKALCEHFVRIAGDCLLDDGYVATTLFKMGPNECISHIIRPMAADGVSVDGAQLTAMMRTVARTSTAVGMVAQVSKAARNKSKRLGPTEDMEGIVASMSKEKVTRKEEVTRKEKVARVAEMVAETVAEMVAEMVLERVLERVLQRVDQIVAERVAESVAESVAGRLAERDVDVKVVQFAAGEPEAEDNLMQ